MSPALVAEYQTKMPEKKLLEAKLHEFYELAEQQAATTAITSKELSHDESKPSKKVTKKRPKK
jgi:hypothetical protein